MVRTEQIRKVQLQLLRRRETLTRSLAGEMGSLKNLHESGVGDELDASLAAVDEDCKTPTGLAGRLASLCGYVDADRIPRSFLCEWLTAHGPLAPSDAVLWTWYAPEMVRRVRSSSPPPG